MSSVKRVLLSSLFLALIAPSAPLWAHDLSVDVRSHKQVFVLGEPVVVSITVANHESETVTLMHHNAPNLHQKLSVVDLLLGANQEQLKRWDSRLGVAIRTEDFTLPSGESLNIDLVMLFNSRDGFFVTTPGKYWIAARTVVIAQGEYITPPVQIEVREPPRAERVVWEWLNSPLQKSLDTCGMMMSLE